MAAEAGNGVTPEQLIEKKLAEMEAKDEILKPCKRISRWSIAYRNEHTYSMG